MKRNFWLLLFIAFFLASCGGAAAPASTEAPAATEAAATESPSMTEVVSQPTSIPLTVTPLAQEKPAIPETRRLTLEFPARMRAGVEGDVVRLTLEVDNLGNITPTAQIQGNVVVGQTVQIPNLYDTHNVTAEARLDMAGMEVSPSQPTFEPLKPNSSVTFYWSIRPPETGVYRGTAWLHLNFQERSTGDKSRIAVSAQIVEIEAVDFFGLSVNLARTTGVVGSFIAGIIGFPFLEDIIKYLFNRKKKK